VQDTVVRAIASWCEAAQSVHVDGWMYRIMRNAWIDMQRSKRVRLDYADALRMRSRSECGGEDAAVARLTLGAVDDALQSLPEDQRTVLLLVCVEDLSYAATAAVLDVPVGTVMSRLARARSTLRRLLDEPATSNRQQTESAIGSAQ
jgi:RNA polymerase sigma-70 factor, ECF subfamily